MKKIVFLILILSSLSVSAEKKRVPTSEPSALQKNFLETTKLQVGDYELEGSDTQCWDGSLEIVDFSEDLTILLGARPLAITIGKPKYEEKEQGCTLTYETSFSKTEINEKREKICKKEKLVLTTKIVPSQDSLFYARVIKLDDKIISNFECKLKFVKKDNK